MTDMKETMEGPWEDLIEDLANGRRPVLGVMQEARENMYSEGDHLGFVNHTRAMHAMLQDKRILLKMIEELKGELKKISQDGLGQVSRLSEAVRKKDGHRLMSKLGDVQAELYGDGPSLLTGSNFEECLVQYQALLTHIEGLWDDACDAYRRGRYPHCAFTSILAVEELGKLGRLWRDLLAYDQPVPSPSGDLGALGRDHRKKHFMGVVQGAVVDERLDRILGKNEIRTVLQDVDSGKLEIIRQSCLYIDMVGGKVVLPGDLIGQEDAKFYVVLAGELWADVLGDFPWDYDRMFKKVKEFELEIGFSQEVVEALS